MATDNPQTEKNEYVSDVPSFAREAGPHNSGMHKTRNTHSKSVGTPILVLGMHRSGTSAITRVLGLMGAHLGKTDELLPSHPQDNPTGYWELAELNAVHDRFLHAAGFAWDKVAGLDATHVAAETRQELSARLRAILDRSTSNGKPFVLKDPRLCLILSQWRPLLRSPAYVIVVRDPREIASSMRDGPRGVYTSHYVIALWEKYLRTAIEELRGQPALFVSYPRLLAEPTAQGARLLRGLRELGVGNLRAPSKSKLKSFLDPLLRRSVPQPHMQLSSPQQALFAWFEAQCAASGPVTVDGFPEGPSPDAVLLEYTKVLDNRAEFGRSAALGESASRLTQLEVAVSNTHAQLLTELATQRDQAAQARAQSEILKLRILEVEQQRDHFDREHQHQAQQAAQLSDEAQRFLERIAHLENEREQQTGHTSELVAEVQRFRDQIAQLENELAQQTQHTSELVGEAQRFREQIAQLENEREQQTQHTSELIGEVQRFRDQIAQLENESEQQTRHTSELVGEAQRFREQIAQLENEREQQTQHTSELVGEVQRFREQIAQLENESEQQTRHTTELVGEAQRFRERIAQLENEREQQRLRITQLESEREQQDRRIAQLGAHAINLEQTISALRHSLSWKISAPLRAVAEVLTPRVPWNIEQRLYRAYYAMPGLSGTRKRALIQWLHEHSGWLTRRTLSYRLNEQAQHLKRQRINDPVERERMQRMDQQRADALLATLSNPPRISIVMPVYNVEQRWLLAAVDSVRHQFYPHWELCIADDASTRDETRSALDAIAKTRDSRIKICRLKHNVGIAGASNAALQLATGEYVGLLDHDDELTRDALLEMAQRIVADDADLVYSDEDKLDENGSHVEPHFKPDYTEDYLFSINYLCHFSAIRRSLLDRIGGFRPGYDGAQDYDLLLRVTEHTDKIAHIPKVLYHWRKIAGSTSADSSAKPQTSEAGRRALAESLARRGIDARAEAGPFPNSFCVRRKIHGDPLVSIIVPFRDKPELLDACVKSILGKTRYRNFEFIGVDNNSVEPATADLLRDLRRRDTRVRFVHYDAPFNYSAINNFAAKQAQGQHLLFLNNDTEVLCSDWLDALVEHSQRPEVGVVGAKLLYADNTLQHTGVIVGLGGVAGHAHLFLPAQHPGYFARAQVAQNLSAVTFACAMTRRDVFEQLEGLNERDLTIAFNDIDYCLRAREAGYLVVYTPNAMLYHYESKSRGYEDNPEKQKRFAAEIAYMQQRHAQTLRRGDPYYNPNLSLTHAFEIEGGYANILPV